MRNRYEQTLLWQKTLGRPITSDIYEKEREKLRVGYENFRKKAAILASEISQTLPEFTVHDITHMDALWEMAELITDDSFNLTPTEAFVLGGSFLIHDLGMGLAAFPKGINELKELDLWKDIFHSLIKKNKTPSKNDKASIEKKATEAVLRQLHAAHAEKLASIGWATNEGDSTFLIEDRELRESFANVIGLIAHSHWKPTEELESYLPKYLGAPGCFPQSWTVDPLKLACILRIADAIQIDDRRAPSFLRTIRELSHYSDNHWNFQQKLYQPRIEKNRLVFTSKSPFRTEESESWWMCYDTILMIDDEVKKVDSLLTDTARERLNVIGVASADDPGRLGKLITVEGWQPVDTKIKVSNIANLVNSLGGEQLYGDNIIVPLRELIQNASDAIRARRTLENENDQFGEIIITTGKDEYGYYIEVCDNGIGMSSSVLTGPFLDFGVSFWGSSLMHTELPGLEAKGFNSTGKYGIGFFSVFMWGNKVRVSTKRYEKGRDETICLDFSGTKSRPLLRKANTNEFLKDGGTSVRVWFTAAEKFHKLFEGEIEKIRKKLPLKEVVSKLCPALDCNIVIEEKGQKKRIIKANDWKTIKGINLLRRILGESYYNCLDKEFKNLLQRVSENMELITEEGGTVVGRAFVYKDENPFKREYSINGVVTIGGFSASTLSGLIGVFIGVSDRASRDVGMPIITKKTLSDWAAKQAELLSEAKLSEETQIECASIIRHCQGSTGSLKIAYSNNGALNSQELKEAVKSRQLKLCFIIQDAEVTLLNRTTSKIKYYDNVFWVAMGLPGILNGYRRFTHLTWPSYGTDNERWFDEVSLNGLLQEIICETWQVTMEDLYSVSEFSSDEKSITATIGETSRKKKIKSTHVDILKKPN